MDRTAIQSTFSIPTVADINWRAMAPLTGFNAPTPIDVAGNDLGSAFNVGTLNGYGTYRDTVSSTDSDYYKFSLTQTGRVNLAVYGAVDGALLNSGGFTPNPAGGKRLSQVLSPGTYYIQVGSGAPAEYTLELSVASMPAPPTQLDLVSRSDSGVSQTDRITKITTPVVTGLAQANAKVELFNGATKLGEALANGTGRWEITSSLVLAPGIYNLTARSLNAMGDASANSAALTIVIDTQTATPTLLTPEFAPGNAAMLRGSAEAGALVQVFEGTQLLGTTTASATGSWQLTSRALEIGTYFFSAIATDIAGNVSPQSLVTSWVVPAAVLAAPQGLRLTAATDSGQSQTDNVTNNLSPTVAGTAPVGTTVRLFRHQQFLGQAATDATGAWSLALASPLPSGTYALSAIATTASSISPTTSLTVTIDPLVPTAQVNVLADSSTTPAALANGAVLATGMRLVGQADGTLSAIAALKYKLGTNPEVAIAVTPEGLFNQLLDLTGVTGSQTLVITGTDKAGNALPALSYSVTVNPLPSNGLVLLAQLTQDTGSDAADGWTSTPGVSGRVLSAQSPVTGLWGRFEGGSTTALQNLSAALGSNGGSAI
jgi:Bacterial Ig-like domain